MPIHVFLADFCEAVLRELESVAERIFPYRQRSGFSVGRMVCAAEQFGYPVRAGRIVQQMSDEERCSVAVQGKQIEKLVRVRDQQKAAVFQDAARLSVKLRLFVRVEIGQNIEGNDAVQRFRLKSGQQFRAAASEKIFVQTYSDRKSVV